jgi:AraC-like DNA-binding protein
MVAMRALPLHRCTVHATPWVGVHCTQVESARHYGRHWHDSHGLGLIDGGAQRSASGRGLVEAQAGDLIATNPGEVHDGQPLGDLPRRWRMLYFDRGALQTPDGRAAETLLAPVIRDPPLTLALRTLLHRVGRWNAASRDGAATLACDEALAVFGAVMSGRHAEPSAGLVPHPSVRHARDLLAEHLDAPPGLQALADAAGLGKYQLLRRFAGCYGMTPYAWLLQQRGERARALIRRGLPLAEAAADCGFADQSHMTRAFMRQFGFTPGAWRQACGLS